MCVIMVITKSTYGRAVIMRYRYSGIHGDKIFIECDGLVLELLSAFTII